MNGILEIAEGFYVANVLEALEGLGILDSLKLPASVSSLAKRHRVDEAILDAALRMLVLRTNLVARRAGKFCLTRHYDAKSRFMLHQYLGAYGKNAVQLGAILCDPSSAKTAIDRERHAKAFAQIDVTSANIVADLVSQLGLNRVLDLGCGAGTLLVNLAMRDSEFIGWGLDSNRWMCAEARKRIAAARAAGRVKVFEGDCRNVEVSVPARVHKAVTTITAASVANEFFEGGTKPAVEWLAGLKAAFPGRVLVLADYYGQPASRGTARSREVTLHDFVQAISGQGIPPANLAAWKRIYRSARCDVVHVFELKDSPFFVHFLRL